MAFGERVDPLMLTIGAESVERLRSDRVLPQLVLEYHEEVGSPAFAPDPDWAAMADLEARGDLLCMLARERGKLAGFAVWRFMALLGFRSVRIGFAEFLYLSPDARKQGGARHLLAASERAMRDKGIVRCAIHDSTEAPHDFKTLGYGVAMRVWMKDLVDVFGGRRAADHNK